MGTYNPTRDKNAEASRQIFYGLLEEYKIDYKIINTHDAADNGMDVVMTPIGHKPIIVDHKSNPVIDHGNKTITVAYSYGEYGDKYFRASPNYNGCLTNLFVHTPLNKKAVCYWRLDMRYSFYPLSEKSRAFWRVPKHIKDGCIAYVVHRSAVFNLEDWLSNIHGNKSKKYRPTGYTPDFMKSCKPNFS